MGRPVLNTCQNTFKNALQCQSVCQAFCKIGKHFQNTLQRTVCQVYRTGTNGCVPGPRLAMYDGLAQHKFQVINIVVLEHLDCRTGKPQTENERGVVFLVAENKGAF